MAKLDSIWCERPPATATADQPGKGIICCEKKLNDQFFGVVT